ncbi:GNAT family N-acetyltransferase [Paenibacillus glycanilyticus]|uniref:GNAT family N-acetyltransferase n=1 Tax=Paenibacillus glycanilyticus TaxID=126569 RepID=UPI00203EFE72|nr:GNAT family N-acetyltransferase [Paenibacillus glycanilyticus]MCM3628284.1 GNAT family N-acetyltransferase [Paenibacillus glycanilyticus]
MNELHITKAAPLIVENLKRLVDESTGEGFRHVLRLANDYEAGTNRFDKEGEALFIAIQHGEIVGICGLNQDPYSSDSRVGRVRRLYVLPSVRRFGIGRMLMESVIAEAKDSFQILVLRTDNPDADLFYQSIGFSVSVGAKQDTHFVKLSHGDMAAEGRE